MRTIALVPVAAGLLLATACGGKHTGTYEKLAASGDAAAADPKIAEAEAAWEKRVERAELVKALAAYEEIVNAQPDNRQAYERLVRGWYFLGDAHSTETDQKVEEWGHAIEWGARCLALNDEFATKIKAGEKERDAISVAKKEDVPCIYWTASALGKWGKAQSLSKTLKHLPTVKAYITKAEELDPTFWHYGPARYWGAYYAALPSFAGQDADKSGEYLAASIQGAPNYLGTRVLRAEYLAVLEQDPNAFKEDLNFVLSADPAAVPELQPENTMEQAKAKRLMAELNELFDKKTLEEAAAADGGE